MSKLDPRTVYETTWWEYVVLDGVLQYGPWSGGVKSPLMRKLDSGEIVPSRDLPTGALYEARDDLFSKIGSTYRYPKAACDGKAIYCVQADGHHWLIEGRASNCTKKDDTEHRCWVRHGTIGERVTVDKNGLTCAAGAGSFFMGDDNEWHGFLRDGRMTP